MTANGPEKYFILIYHVAARHVDVREFGGDADASMTAYADLEDEHRRDDDVEVVMVGAASLDVIETTHSHYFTRVDNQLFAAFLD